ncbi:MAG: DUF1684 domain-containing protein [Dehalococcoidia bacterium]|nr:DUF1684 domain-containing protein [Dehalococcoidia bacterium]
MSQLEQFRLGKDEFFRDAPESPLSPSQHRDFTGLRYYKENEALVFELVAEPFPIQDLIAMRTSTGGEAEYVRWARVSFEVDGQEAGLTLYREQGSGHIFLPFQDANAGGETYGAGRYLEVLPLGEDRVLLDFNYAYNPYCAYNDGWSCPLPPSENRLQVAIRAGEQTFEPGH